MTKTNRLGVFSASYLPFIETLNKKSKTRSYRKSEVMGKWYHEINNQKVWGGCMKEKAENLRVMTRLTLEKEILKTQTWDLG